jgi:hypothetical protein
VLVETIGLPHGVALVRVQVGSDKVVLVNARLTENQKLAARVAACILALNGSSFVMVGLADVLAVLNDAA